MFQLYSCCYMTPREEVHPRFHAHRPHGRESGKGLARLKANLVSSKTSSAHHVECLYLSFFKMRILAIRTLLAGEIWGLHN